MDRRSYIRVCGAVAVGSSGLLAGCLGGGGNGPPPRRSSIIEEVSVTDGTLVIEPEPQSDRWVDSRRDIDTEQNSVAGTLRSLWPVGRAQAQKGRGARGRGSGGYSDAPRTSNGYAWYGASGGHTGWYNNHSDEVTRFPVALGTIGVAYIGSNERFQQRSPGPGPLDWDETYDDPSGTVTAPMPSPRREGWYRVGTEVRVDGNTDLGWECLDCRVEDSAGGYEITERWKVSPRI